MPLWLTPVFWVMILAGIAYVSRMGRRRLRRARREGRLEVLRWQGRVW